MPAPGSAPVVTAEAGTFRGRLLEGMARALREKSLADTQVADVVAFARTSRRTFYEHFADKEECYIALCREHNQALVRDIVGAVDPDASWEEQIERAVGAWVTSAAQEPEIMRSWIRELALLGPRARGLQREMLDSLTAMAEGLVSSDVFRTAGIAAPDREAVVLLIGGLRELMAVTVEDGKDIESIREVAVEVTKALLRA